MTKTNAVRMLEQSGIVFRIRTYPVDESALDAVSVATELGVNADRVFKTLVTENERGDHFVFCVPGSAELDLKKAAAVAGSKRIALIRLRELLPLTGYVHGGCSPLEMKRRFPTWIDESCVLFDTIFVSGGARGIQIEIAVDDLVNLSGAIRGDLTSV
jgi:Cys-tRNA(Pro)/Cys-tRNA(Cys) deacylase